MKKVFVLAVFAAALGLSACCTKGVKSEQAQTGAKQVTLESFSTAEEKVDFIVSEMNQCSQDSDCVAVFPSCCGEALPPFFVNKAGEKSFTAQYKKIHGQETCPEFSRCPRSYFGGMKNAACVNKKCAINTEAK